MKLSRHGLRLNGDAIQRVDDLAQRCSEERGKSISRAAMLRSVLQRGLAGIDDDRPITEQLPVSEHEGDHAQRARRPRADGLSLRDRVVNELVARPGEVFTPARLAPLVGATTRDTVRNTLLVLATQGRIEKVGPGQYRARAAVVEGA